MTGEGTSHRITRTIYVGRVNSGGWHLTCHKPELLCWSWSIWIIPLRKENRGFGKKVFRNSDNGHIGIRIELFLVDYGWQDYDYPALGRTPGAKW